VLVDLGIIISTITIMPGSAFHELMDWLEDSYIAAFLGQSKKEVI
jgi:hypothetical protein